MQLALWNHCLGFSRLGQLLSHFGCVQYRYRTIIMAPSIGWYNYCPTLGVYSSTGIKQLLWLQVLTGTVIVLLWVCTLQVSNDYFGSMYWLGQLLSYFGCVDYRYQTIILAPSIGWEWDRYCPVLSMLCEWNVCLGFAIWDNHSHSMPQCACCDCIIYKIVKLYHI